MEHSAPRLCHDFGIWRPDFLMAGRHFVTISNPAKFLEKCQTWPSPHDLDNLFAAFSVKNHRDLPLVVADCPPKPRGAKRRRLKKSNPGALSYEQQVYHLAKIPTRRENWHDLFNALIWCRFPKAKSAFNQRQVEAASPGIVRTREQERLTLFDEGGVIRVVQGTVIQSFVFGHALYESTLMGRLDVYAMTVEVILDSNKETFAEVDQKLAELVLSGWFQRGEASGRTLLADLV